jgi:hypothetical protein
MLTRFSQISSALAKLSLLGISGVILWLLFSTVFRRHADSNSTQKEPINAGAADQYEANGLSANIPADYWSRQESEEEASCISQEPRFPDRDQHDPMWRRQDLRTNHFDFLIYQTLVHCFLKYRAPQNISMNAGLLEGDAMRIEARGATRMQKALDISENDVNSCYLDEVQTADFALHDENLLFGEAQPTKTLTAKLNQIGKFDMHDLDRFVSAFDSQTHIGNAPRIELEADLHRAQKMRDEVRQYINQSDFANALLAAEDSKLLYRAGRDELNCPNTQLE